jgi:DNA-binding HxlR family transcriptional regulator
VEYELTTLGTELIPALDAIVSVGHRLKILQLYDLPQTEPTD